MNYGLLILPWLAALAGWLTHKLAILFILNRYVPKHYQRLARGLSGWVAGNISFAEIAPLISSPQAMKKMQPFIETHIDRFLTEKLQQEIPMLAMFVGTKTTDKIKEVFIGQVQQLLPEMMTGFIENTIHRSELKQLIADQLMKEPNQKKLEQAIRLQLRWLPWLGAGSGFIIGLCGLAMVLI